MEAQDKVESFHWIVFTLDLYSGCACPPSAWEYQHWWSQNHTIFEKIM